MKYRCPKIVTRKSGWSYKGRGTGRNYVTIIDPYGEPKGTYLTVANALIAIRKMEKFPLLYLSK